MAGRTFEAADISPNVRSLRSYCLEAAPKLLELPGLGAFFAFDDEQLLLVTQPALECLGYAEVGEVPSSRLRDLIHPYDLPRVQKGFLRSNGAEGDVPVLRLLRADRAWVDVHASYARLGADAPPLLFCHPVAARRMASELASLPHLERLATLGTIAAALVHEVNNPLAYVLLSLDQAAQQARELGGDAEDAASMLGHIVEARQAAQGIADLVRDVGSLARAQARPVGAVNVRRALDGAVRLIAHDLRRRAKLVLEVSGLPFAAASSTQLEQVFINLLTNAAQAVPSGRCDGEIRVALRVEPPMVVIEVSDNGIGIAEEDLPHVFDPFFTTKVDGFGIGLGLSITHRIVTSLGGKISVHNRQAQGCTFRVELPGCEGDLTPSAVRPKPGRVGHS
jgi:signal transduction histidine kinase